MFVFLQTSDTTPFAQYPIKKTIILIVIPLARLSVRAKFFAVAH